jgi:hypothetical protein
MDGCCYYSTTTTTVGLAKKGKEKRIAMLARQTRKNKA